MRHFLIIQRFFVSAVLVASCSAWAQEMVCDTELPVVKTFSEAKNTARHSQNTVRHSQNIVRHSQNIVRHTKSPAKVYPLTVIASSGLVERVVQGKTQAIEFGQRLYLNDTIKTGSNGFVSVRLGDGTVNVFPPNATVNLQQANPYVARYELIRGRVESRVTKSPKAKQNTFEVRLPTVSIGVRGTHFSVDFEPETGRMQTEVNEGVVRVNQRNTCSAPLWINANQAARLDMLPWTKRSLLAAPRLQKVDQAQLSNDLNFAVVPVVGARKYVTQVAEDASFINIIKELESPNENIVWADDQLKDGFYYVRIMAVDDLELRGAMFQSVFLRNRKASLD